LPSLPKTPICQPAFKVQIELPLIDLFWRVLVAKLSDAKAASDELTSTVTDLHVECTNEDKETTEGKRRGKRKSSANKQLFTSDFVTEDSEALTGEH